MNRKAEETAARHGMFPAGCQVVAGVSGGGDSMAMLHLLLHPTFSLPVTVCHVNHMLRGKESDRDEAFVAKLCKAWGVPCKILRCDVAALARKKKIGVEECARLVRYDFFEQTAAKLSEASGAPVRIAVAHTLSDRVETMLFHLARGTSAKGLCSIPAVRGEIVRPLIDCSRREVEGYCAWHNIPHVTDSTNRSVAYTRNRIRLRVVPELRLVNAGAEENARRLMEDIREDDEYLSALAEEALLRARRGQAYGAGELDALPVPVKKRAAAMILERWNAEKSAAQIDRFCKIIGEKSGTLNLSGGRRAQVKRGICSLWEPPEPYFEIPLTDGEHPLPGGGRVVVQTFDKKSYPAFQKIHKNEFHYRMDCDKIMNNFVLRQKRPGDRITLSRRGVTKTLKKLFCEAGLTERGKSLVPVFADQNGVLAAGRLGMDARAEPDEHTVRYKVIAFV